MRITFLSERIKIFFALSIVAVAALLMLGSFETVQAEGERNWKLVYNHDENGNPISGSLEALIAAIRNGADVHILVHHSVWGEVLIKPQRVRVEVGGTRVIGLLTESNQTAGNEMVHRLMICRTDGTRDTIFQQNSGQENITEKVPMSWFVMQ